MAEEKSHQSLLQLLIQRTYKSMCEYEDFRNKYPDPLPARCRTRNCVLCNLKGSIWVHPFKEDDIKTAGNPFCQFIMDLQVHKYDNINGPGYQLTKAEIKELKEISKYIYIIGAPNHTKLEAYVPIHLALELCGHLSLTHPEHSHCFYDSKVNKCIAVWQGKPVSHTEFDSKFTGAMGPYYHMPYDWQEEMLPLFEGDNRLVRLQLAGSEKGDLFKILLTFLEKNAHMIAKDYSKS